MYTVVWPAQCRSDEVTKTLDEQLKIFARFIIIKPMGASASDDDNKQSLIST